MKKVAKVLNRCKFLSIGLNLCGITNTGCSHMADPHACPTYDEDFDRAYVATYKDKSPAEVAQAESKRIDMEVESLTEFVDRIEGELDGMGIKVERGEVEDVVEETPEWF